MNTEILEQPKSNKSKRVPIIVTAVVLCVLAIGGGVYAFINSTPEAKVLKGIKETTDELKNNKGIFEKTVGEDYVKTLTEKGFNENMKLSLKSSNLPELTAYNGSGFSLDYSYDEKNKKLLADLGAQYKGTSVGNAKFYTDNNKLMLSVPQLYDAWFTCDADNIQKQYNDSTFGKSNKMPDKELNIKVFDDEKALEGKEFYDAVLKGYLAENAGKLAEIGKNIKVEKAKETKNIEIGGVSQECTGYNVVITGQDAKAFVEGVSDYMLEDPEIKKELTKSAKYSYLQQTNKHYSSPEDMVNDIYKQWKAGNEKVKKALEYSDINAVVYLDKKGRAVGLDLNTSLTANGKKADMKFTGDLKGGDNLGNIADMSLELKSNGETVKFDFDNNTTTKDDAVNQAANLVLTDNSKEVFTVNLKSDYNTKSGDFNGSIDGTSGGEGINASASGNFKFDKSSKKLDLDFDKIDLKSNLKYGNNFNISLDGSLSVAPLDNAIEEPTGEKLEAFKLSDTKLMEIVQEVQTNATKIAGTLN